MNALSPSRFRLRSASFLAALAGFLSGFDGGSGLAGPLQQRQVRLYVNFSPSPPAADLLAHNVCLLDANCRTDLGAGRALGHTYLARLSVVTVTPGSEAGERARELGLVLPEADGNGGWDRLLLDVLEPGWAREMIEVQAKNAAMQGFAGFVIEGAELLPELDALRPEKSAAHREAFVALVRGLQRRFPDKQIVLHRGFGLLPEVQRQLHGVFLDGAFREAAGEEGLSRPVPAERAAEVELQIRLAQSRGLKVYVAEPGDPADTHANRDAAARLARIGCAAFVTGVGLDGLVLGPHLPESGRALVLHGWDPASEGHAQRPAVQTWTARTLGPALRWLGLEPEYLAVPEWAGAVARPERLLHPLPAAIVIDADTIVPAAQQDALADWLARAVENGVPVVLGGQPLTERAAWEKLARPLGLGGSGQEFPASGHAGLSGYRADWFLPGSAPELRALCGYDLQAGAEAERILSYRRAGADAPAETVRFDACFTAAWGGAWIARAAAAPLDSFRFLETALRRQSAAPVVDTSTLAGRRIYLSTVQGRGFCEPSWLPGGQACGEVLRAELEKVQALPVTVAVAEADIRGWSAGSEPAEAGRYEAVARALFAQPQVEPASNTLTRPASWLPGEFQPGPLRTAIPEDRAGLEREIAGSLDFVRRRLTPPGKSAGFLLWPEGSAPGRDALDLLAGSGGLQLPGSWESGWNLGGQENDGGYAAGAVESAPQEPGSAEAIAAAWLQNQNSGDTARRTGPVHLAYAFADLKKPVNVQALRQIWSWCAAQPLHPMSASGYARFLADAAAAQVYTVAENHWRVVSSGRPVTLRLPAARGLPDLARSFGVTGYAVHAGQLYLYLAGREVSEIVLRPAEAAPPHLHLVAADRLIDFLALSVNNARFRVQGRDAAEVTLGGLEPGVWYQITASGSQARLQAGDEGRLTFKAPPLATIHIEPGQIAGKPYAAR